MPSRTLSHPLNFPQKYLDLTSVKELPDTHAWGSDEHPSSCGSTMCTPESVPIIDLNHKNATELIGHACKSWGVFQVINHEISNKLLDDVEFAGKALFSLPMHQKLQVARPPDGLTGYGVARISSFFPKLMWSEGFTIMGSPIEHAIQLWPHDYKNFW